MFLSFRNKLLGCLILADLLTVSMDSVLSSLLVVIHGPGKVGSKWIYPDKFRVYFKLSNEIFPSPQAGDISKKRKSFGLLKDDFLNILRSVYEQTNTQIYYFLLGRKTFIVRQKLIKPVPGGRLTG